MRNQTALLITLIISHLLVNVVWASSHKGVDIQDANNMPHLHFYTHSHDHDDTPLERSAEKTPYDLLMELTTNGYDFPTADSIDQTHDHSSEPHICLVFQVSNLFSMAALPIHGSKPMRLSWQSVTHSQQPPVPPPLA